MFDEDSPLVLACNHVIALDRDVDMIVHHADGMWQFTCNQPVHSMGGAGPIHIHHIIDRFPELAAVMLRTPRGHLSERTEESWVLLAHDD